MANNLTKKDLESFGATIGKSFEVVKKEIREEKEFNRKLKELMKKYKVQSGVN